MDFIENLSLRKKVISVIIIFALMVGLPTCLTKINAGYAGVVYNMSGGVEEKALSQGWHIVSPFKKVTEYPISTETVYLSKDEKEGSDDDDSFYISTKDGKTVNVDVAYSYRMDFDKLPSIFTKFRGRSDNEIENGFMRDRLKESCNVISTTMDVQEVYGDKRQQLNNGVFERFSEQLLDVGIIVETFSFTRVEPDTASMKAIQQKVDAKQKLDTMKVEKEQAQIQAEKRIIEAQGIADSKLLQAEAQAKANKLLEQSLTNGILKNKWIEKWDGKVPQVDGNSSVMMNLQ